MDSRTALHSYVALPHTQARLQAYVRRRGVLRDPEDVVQEVICDALAVQAVPGEPNDIPRLLNTIAKRRVADWYRKKRGQRGVEVVDLPTSRDPEVRDLLLRVNAGLKSEAERATLSWLLREHAGESLKDIAHELSMDAQTLRQRVSRLRRHLRARYLGAVVLGLFVLLGAASLLESTRVPDVALSRATHGFDGQWRIVASSRAESALWAWDVTVNGSDIRVTAPGGRTLMTLWCERLDEHTWLVHAKDGAHRTRVDATEPDRVRLSSADGFVVLERARVR